MRQLTDSPSLGSIRSKSPNSLPYSRPSDSAVLDVIGKQGRFIDGIEYRDSSILVYGGNRYIFSHRAIFTVVVMAACNAACKFCSNEITFTPSGPYLKYDHKLARAKDFALLGGVTKVAFTGGEPTLHPQGLAELTREVIPGFQRARLHTNGSRLFETVVTEDGGRPLLDVLRTNGLTGTSISVAHWDPVVNQRVMRWKSGWTAIDDEDLSRIAAYDSESFSSRMSCVMTAESVATPEDMITYMLWGRRLGYRRFIFRTCSQIPEPFQKPTEYAAFNTTNANSIEHLAGAFDSDDRFELIYRQRKSDSKVDVYRWEDVVFDIDESSEEADPDPKIRRLNFMPDLATYTSWIDPQSFLFDDDRQTARRPLIEMSMLLRRSGEAEG